VAVVSANEFVVYALDWWSPEPPTLEQLRGIGPLAQTHHHHRGGLAHLNISCDEPVPPDFDWLGSLPVPIELQVPPASYSGWALLQGAVALQRRWDTLVPESAQSAYRSGRSDVLGDFGAGLVQVSTTASRLDLTDGTVVPAAGPLRWSALDAFPRCTSLTWSGHDRGLAAALFARPNIDTLSWSAVPSTVDLSGTALTDLRLSGPAIDRVTLPSTLQQLTLDAAGMPHTVVVPDRGRFGLTIDNAGPELTLPHGLNGVASLNLACDCTVSVAGLRRLPGLRSLRVRWQNPPGELADAHTLTDLHELVLIELVNAYGLRPDTLPNLPNLRTSSSTGCASRRRPP
jgi:hypothetical protein